MNKKIAIIGGGNLGTAIAEGLIQSGFVLPKHILITKRNIQTLHALERKGVLVSDKNEEAVRYADLVILDPGQSLQVSKENILYKCGWSPLEGFQFPAKITHTFVNGHLVYGNGDWDESQMGQRLRFDR